jgi:hypothetical protein
MATPDPSLAKRELDDEVFMSVQDLKKYMAEQEMAKTLETLAAHDRAAEAKKELIKKLSTRIEFTPERIRAFLGRVKMAAARGETELMIGRFPVELCTDRGRAINNVEKDWPDTLTGLPQQAFEIWRDHLHPLGYQLKAMIVDWPEGLPGEVGLFLAW